MINKKRFFNFKSKLGEYVFINLREQARQKRKGFGAS
jgi:hypothetical protein